MYYAHPYSSYERGTNEDANGIIRRFFPKGTNFGRVPLGGLMKLQDWMNNYPRPILGWYMCKYYINPIKNCIDNNN